LLVNHRPEADKHDPLGVQGGNQLADVSPFQLAPALGSVLSAEEHNEQLRLRSVEIGEINIQVHAGEFGIVIFVVEHTVFTECGGSATFETNSRLSPGKESATVKRRGVMERESITIPPNGTRRKAELDELLMQVVATATPPDMRRWLCPAVSGILEFGAKPRGGAPLINNGFDGRA